MARRVEGPEYPTRQNRGIQGLIALRHICHGGMNASLVVLRVHWAHLTMEEQDRVLILYELIENGLDARVRAKQKRGRTMLQLKMGSLVVREVEVDSPISQFMLQCMNQLLIGYMAGPKFTLGTYILPGTTKTRSEQFLQDIQAPPAVRPTYAANGKCRQEGCGHKVGLHTAGFEVGRCYVEDCACRAFIPPPRAPIRENATKRRGKWLGTRRPR